MITENDYERQYNISFPTYCHSAGLSYSHIKFRTTLVQPLSRQTQVGNIGRQPRIFERPLNRTIAQSCQSRGTQFVLLNIVSGHGTWYAL